MVNTIKDHAEASSDPATKCRSRSRSLASITSHGGIPPALLYRRSSSQAISADTTTDIPFADAESQDQILDEIMEEQEDSNNHGADKR